MPTQATRAFGQLVCDETQSIAGPRFASRRVHSCILEAALQPASAVGPSLHVRQPTGSAVSCPHGRRLSRTGLEGHRPAHRRCRLAEDAFLHWQNGRMLVEGGPWPFGRLAMMKVVCSTQEHGREFVTRHKLSVRRRTGFRKTCAAWMHLVHLSSPSSSAKLQQ